MIRVQGVQKYFNNRPLFEPISTEAHPGTVTIVKGPNGSGKTTLLKGLSGHLSFEKGQVDFLNHDKKKLTDISSLSLSQDSGFFPQLTIKQNFNFFLDFFNTTTNYTSIAEELSLMPWWEHKYQECSTGIKKRLGLLRSLMSNPKLLLIDEPFSNMDQEFCNSLSSFIYQTTVNSGLITFISSHRTLPEELKQTQIVKVKPCSAL